MVDWPHSPIHRLSDAGVYMVTAGTYRRQPFLAGGEHLTLVRDMLFAHAAKLRWQLQAWAVLPNHYHFIAQSPPCPATLRTLIQQLHGATAHALNATDRRPGRRVWFEYWDSRITFEKSFFARLKYVHLNPVKHGLAENAERYPWCSAAWFAREANRSFQRTVMSFPIDRLKVVDMECGGSPPL